MKTIVLLATAILGLASLSDPIDGYKAYVTSDGIKFESFVNLDPINLPRVSIGERVLNLNELVPEAANATNEYVAIAVPNPTGKYPSQRWRRVEVVRVRTKDAVVIGAYGSSPLLKKFEDADTYISEKVLSVIREIDKGLQTAKLSDGRYVIRYIDDNKRKYLVLTLSEIHFKEGVGYRISMELLANLKDSANKIKEADGEDNGN